MRSIFVIALPICFISCVSTGKFKALQQDKQKVDSLYTWSMRTLQNCQDDNARLDKQKSVLQDQANDMNEKLTATQGSNSQLRKQIQDLLAMSSAQAESIKKSLDNMGAKDNYIMDLRSAVSHRDSVNLAAILNLKATLGGFGAQDVNIKLERGTVYVDLSDSLLFNGDSTSYTLTTKAKQVLSRLARVLNEQPDLEFTVEGHTDSIPPADSLSDNWDLSVKRATAVVRILQNQYNVSPIRMTAAGRSEYTPIAANDTPEGRSANRRTRIILIPHLERLLDVLDHREGQRS